ncbi:NAD(P)-dependent oxidoreductase [Myroides injenensis]|uniref:NAD(P)-dependent oxidoreductase n=1 Tax=Myroides injenensis TaxID=1183151 RepID=UPI000288A95B|nr:NAD(P)-dependent oxidoreductase [Myroides injenensis]
MKTSGWIGLGNMGTPMASNLLKAGYTLNIYLRNPNKSTSLIDEGAKGIGDFNSFIDKTDVIFLTLPDDKITEETFCKIINNDIAGKTFINSSTISPQLAQKLNNAITLKQGIYIDAPVSGSVKPAQDGTLSFLIGAKEKDYLNNIPYFEVMGKHHYYLGEAGNGSKAKLAINYYMSVVVQGLAETVLFAEQNGISREMMTAVINDGACGSGMSKIKTPAIIKDEYPAAFPLKFMLKDLRLAQDQGWNSDLIKVAEQAYAKASEEGFAENDLMAVIKTIKQ